MLSSQNVGFPAVKVPNLRKLHSKMRERGSPSFAFINDLEFIKNPSATEKDKLRSLYKTQCVLNSTTSLLL